MAVKVTYHEFRMGVCALNDKEEKEEEDGAVVTMPGFKKVFMALWRVHNLAKAMESVREQQKPVQTPRVAAS